MAPTGHSGDPRRGTDRGSGSLSGLRLCDHPDSEMKRPGDLSLLAWVALSADSRHHMNQRPDGGLCPLAEGAGILNGEGAEPIRR